MLVVDVHVVQLRWGCSWRDGMSFRVVYTGTRPGVSPAIRAGKGWRGHRELAPRCSATQLGACSCVHIDRDMCAILGPYHHHHHHHHHHHSTLSLTSSPPHHPPPTTHHTPHTKMEGKGNHHLDLPYFILIWFCLNSYII